MPPRRSSRGNQENSAANSSSAGPSGQNDANPSSGVNNSASAPLTDNQWRDFVSEALKELISSVRSLDNRLSGIHARVDELEQQRDESKEGASVPSAFHLPQASSGQHSESSSSDQGSSSSPADRQGSDLSGSNGNQSTAAISGSRNNIRSIVDKASQSSTSENHCRSSLSSSVSSEESSDDDYNQPRAAHVTDKDAADASSSDKTIEKSQCSVITLDFPSCSLSHSNSFNLTMNELDKRSPTPSSSRSSVSKEHSSVGSSFLSLNQSHSHSHDVIDDIDLSDSGGFDVSQSEANDYFSDYSQSHSSSRSVFDTGW
jgi:hypothetical protein